MNILLIILGIFVKLEVDLVLKININNFFYKIILL